MAKEDAARWNSRYAQDSPDWQAAPRSILLENLHRLPASGLALDIAMGRGQNAAALMEHGLTVVGIDISSSAAQQARRRLPGLLAVIADLEHGYLPAARFDVIVNFYYLERSLFARFPEIIKPGGLVIIETLTRDFHSQRNDIDPRFLLEPGELRQWFERWEIEVYREGWVTSDHGHQKAVASLIARWPSNV